jgi:Cu+-exporting ATPase
MKSNELTITGMTCASCAARIEKVVGGLNGVKLASVNLATEKADIIYEPSVVRLSAIRKAVADAGYTPRDLEESELADQDALRKQREIHGMWRRFAVAASASVPLLYLAMGHMFPGLALPLPSFLDPAAHPLGTR